MNPEPKIIPVRCHGENADIELLADAVASDGLSLMILSAAGPQMAINAVIAGLRNPGTLRFAPKLPRLYGATSITDLFVRGTGYDVSKTPIGYDLWHMVAIARNNQMLIADNADALWTLLNGPKYTTPLLRAWLPAIEPELRRNEALRKLRSFGCDAAQLFVSNEQLDKIVTEGIQHGRMVIA